MTRNQISTWPMWKSDFHMTHGEIVAHFTENWSCGNQISAWPKNSSNSSSSKWFLHGSCGNQISTWPMWKSDFFSLVQLVISRIFWKCMEIFQWPSLILTHTGIFIWASSPFMVDVHWGWNRGWNPQINQNFRILWSLIEEVLNKFGRSEKNMIHCKLKG